MTAAELLAECAAAGVSVDLSDTPGRLWVKWPSEEVARKFRPLLLKHRSELLDTLFLALPRHKQAFELLRQAQLAKPKAAPRAKSKAESPAIPTRPKLPKGAGIETKYRGTTFRSRLEARWAHLLDELELGWEYEPFDAKGYIPDFVIVGQRPLLLEVKPDVSVHTLYREAPRIEDALRGLWEHDVMIVGSVVYPYAGPGPSELFREGCGAMPAGYGDAPDYPAAGVMGEYNDADDEPNGWCWGAGHWTKCAHCNATGWFHEYQWFCCRPCGHHNGGRPPGPGVRRQEVDEMFTRGRDLTRWRPGTR